MQAVRRIASSCVPGLFLLLAAAHASADTTAPLKFTPIPTTRSVAAHSTAPLRFTPIPGRSAAGETTASFVGSVSCRDCHQKFYELWSTSFHGLAMQPYSEKLATEKLTEQTSAIVVGKDSYIAETGPGQGWVLETTATGKQKYPIEHVMGGKNVFYFLTPLERGRLQTLPVAYDVRRKEWFDTAASALRHFPGTEEDSPIHWKEQPYTFNTACYNCHVSQLTTNYDLKTDTYHTTWLEPGINCETCHGPAGEHNRVFAQAAAAGEPPPKELHLISTRQLTNEQNDELCLTCHTKASPVWSGFVPGDRLHDHFDVMTYEDDDYYADGRDLGENYTYTSWMMSPCVQGSDITCMHCHTSSGRYRFKDTAIGNNACMPCHKTQVENAPAHTHHPAGSAGNLCISCHMPMTDFARMARSDHSMRPPMPSLTKQTGSPNACNVCHTDKSADWADEYVRKWRSRDFQASTAEWAQLVGDARKRDWTRVEQMVKYVTSPNREEMVANSLIRLMRSCDSASCTGAFKQAIFDRSPVIRSSAAESLGQRLQPDMVPLLVNATRDDYRLVRVRAAAALGPIDLGMLAANDRKSVEAAFEELQTSLRSRADDAGSHYNLGNFLSSRGQYRAAIAEYEIAMQLRPDIVLALVNASLAYNAIGDNAGAEKSLRRALQIQPQNAAARLNLALLLGETGRMREAETAFLQVLQLDPKSAVAAYNLAVISAGNGDVSRAVEYCRTAYTARPDEPKYGYTLAFYLQQSDRGDEAGAVLAEVLAKHPAYADAALLSAAIYQKKGQPERARAALTQALSAPGISVEDRMRLEARMREIR
jgi:tetratricopeptide (TPR) repeat protein